MGRPEQVGSRAGDGRPAGATPSAASDDVRLALLRGAGLGEADLLALAAEQASGALGALGGMAHLTASDGRVLRLASAAGLPEVVAGHWARVELADAQAPALAARERRTAWVAASAELGGAGPAVGVLSAPVLVEGEPVGVLSVLVGAEPAADRREFLGAVAAAVGERLPHAGRGGGRDPWWQVPPGLRGRVMRQISVGTWSWDLTTGLLDVDEVAAELMRAAGVPPESWDRRMETWLRHIHPDDRTWVGDALGRAMSSERPYAVEYRVVGEDEQISWLELRATFEFDDGGHPVRMVGTAWNVTERRGRLEWLAGLLELHPDPIHVLDDDNRVEWANKAAREMGTTEGVQLVDWFAGRGGGPHGASDTGGDHPAGRTGGDRSRQEPGPAGQAGPKEAENAQDTEDAAGGEAAAEAAEAPDLLHLLTRARSTPGTAATGEVPLSGPDGRPTGTFYRVRAVEVGGFVATQMADVTEQRAAARAAAERGRHVAELNEALVSALNTSDVVAAITTHLLPLVDADGLIVEDLSGPEPRLVGETGRPAPFVTRLRAHSGTAGLESLVVGGSAGLAPTPEAAAQPPAGTGAEARGASHTGALAEAGDIVAAGAAAHAAAARTPEGPDDGGAWAALPLVVGDTKVGSCVIGWAAPHLFTEDETSLLGTVAVIIAQALTNARQYEEARHRAERLQEELLPGELPETTAVQAVARYSAADGREVGGDWYDTIPLPGGRTLAVVGDVLGHGLEEAISMGILRHAALTVAALDLPVDEVLAHLNDVAVRMGARTGDPAVSATCLLLLYDPTKGTCSIASAGHPAPILLAPGGEAVPLDIPSAPPLGLGQVPAQVTEVLLEDDSVLLLYTDGLLGAQAPDVSRLTTTVTGYAASSPLSGQPTDAAARRAWLDGLCDAVVGGLPPEPMRHDDAALLTLATSRVPEEDIASWSLPWAPESAGQARDLVSERLTTWGLDGLADTVSLIISELMGNTIRHAVGIKPAPPVQEGDIGGDVGDDLEGFESLIGHGGLNGAEETAEQSDGTVRLRLLRLGSSAVCEVYDGSQALPRVRHPLLDDEFGRGLQLVAMLADHWGTRFTERGKCIWARLDSAKGDEVEGAEGDEEEGAAGRDGAENGPDDGARDAAPPSPVGAAQGDA
ncbi:SpoIIE family protein phosphatase [Actinacidiphila yeochonensis]|uniref:SpoIIE family protein phosphatase n=1 Tax=Actinacidiphila yeochonensis TaxID=89050 RepID=UPI00056BFB9F|nr:SpoIIE family protein phosphatase [Actinacidiphila yeochonensis]